MASYNRFTFTAEQLFAGIFRILHAIEQKTMQSNPNIQKELQRIEESIINQATLSQIQDEDLQHYKEIVAEIVDNKVDTTKINTSKFRQNQQP